MIAMTRNLFFLLATVTVVVLAFGYRTSRNQEPAAPTSQVSHAPGKTYAGDRVSTKWGPLQVRITVAGRKVTAVDVPVYPSDNDHDLEVNHRALPILVKETLKAQDAKVDMVSGATYTSKGYRTSLQSALDEAGL